MKVSMLVNGSLEITPDTEAEAGSLKNFKQLFTEFLEHNGLNHHADIGKWLKLAYININTKELDDD